MPCYHFVGGRKRWFVAACRRGKTRKYLGTKLDLIPALWLMAVTFSLHFTLACIPVPVVTPGARLPLNTTVVHPMGDGTPVA